MGRGKSRNSARHGGRRRGGAHASARRKQRAALTGTLRVTGNGVARVETAEGTFHLSKHGLREAMNGDTVGVSLHHVRGGEVRAVVQTVIERATNVFLGIYQPAGPLGAVRPLDARLRHDFFVLPDDPSPARLSVSPGDVVAVRILAYPTRQEAGIVTVERRIGREDAVDLGIQSIMAQYDLTDEYPAAALAEADALILDVDAALEEPLRRDIRDRFLLTIDPVDARDFDDAISLERTPQGGYFLGVHIADVSHYVAWDSSIDLAARSRATSVYMADRVLPMLPERLSNDLCSLRPAEDRLAMTVDIELDRKGRVRAYEAYPSVIRSKLRLDYGTVDAILAGEKDGAEVARAAHAESLPAEGLAAFLACANELAEKRQEIRRKRGAIDFDTVEVRPLVDADGVPTAIAVRRRTAATGLVEEAMLLANECVAEKLADARLAAAYRVHDAPAPDSLANAAATLAEVGVISRADALDVRSGDRRAIEQVIKRTAGEPTAPLVNALLLRAMQRALYKPENQGHYALGAPAYCHFTSPIRRYPDLIVHRVLKLQLLRERTGKAAARAAEPALTGRGPQALDRVLPQICRHSSDQERAADAAQHASEKVKIAQYYTARIGERAAGAVSWVSENGVFVRLEDTQAEGMVHLHDLGGNQYWEVDPVRLRVTGTATGTVITLGQRVIVEVKATDELRGHLDLALIHATGALH